MKLEAFIEVMNTLAPPESALGFDNCGLIVGTEKSDIHRVLVALDCTTAVAEEAAELSCDLVLTHHPLMLGAIRPLPPPSTGSYAPASGFLRRIPTLTLRMAA